MLLKSQKLDAQVLRDQYTKELCPYLSRQEWPDGTLNLWIDIFEEEEVECVYKRTNVLRTNQSTSRWQDTKRVLVLTQATDVGVLEVLEDFSIPLQVGCPY